MRLADGNNNDDEAGKLSCRISSGGEAVSCVIGCVNVKVIYTPAY